MKVLIFLSYHLPNISGITVETQRIARELVRRGHQVTIVTAQHIKELPREEYLEGVKVVRLPVLAYLGKAPLQPSFPFEVVRYVRWADVVNIHWPYAESFYIGLWCAFLRVPLLVTHHVDEPDFSTMAFWAAAPSRIALFVSQLVSGWVAEKLIPRTSDYVDGSLLLRLFQSKVIPCYPAITLPPPDPAARSRFENLFGQFRYKIGFSGRVSRQKGIDYLFKSIPDLGRRLDADFIIVLAGPRGVIGEDHYGELQGFVESFPEQILFLGNLNRSELAAFYEAIDCLVLPSVHRAESFGQVQVEAMFKGVPVVVSDLPGARVPVQITGMGEVVPPRDEEALAEAIARVLGDRESYQRDVKWVQEVFAPEKVYAFYEDLFARVGQTGRSREIEGSPS